MRLFTLANAIRIDSDEEGWYLEVDTDEGDDLFVRLQQNVALDLVEQASQISAWWEEGKALAAEHVREPKPGFAELDDAYEVTDPKHPGFLETADVLRDRERGK